MKLTVLLVHLFTGALMVALPNLSRSGLLFAVPVEPGFRQTARGRRSIAMFRAVTFGLVLLGAIVYLAVPDDSWNAAAGIIPIATTIGVAFEYYWQHRRIKSFEVQHVQHSEVELTTAPERLPGYAVLAVGPFLVLAGAALVLAWNWDGIPARFPVHWGADGVPNRWSERTFRGVYGPLIFAAALCAWMAAMSLGTWFGARRSTVRPVMLGAGIAIGYMLATLFAGIALAPLWRLPFWVVAILPLAFLIPIITALVRAFNRPGDGVEPTPNECWKAGILYYNPADAAVFVEKRDGMGYTLNFARAWSWLMMGTLIFIVGVLPRMVL